ncbi:MAG TPA: iron ABC transporter permease [Parvularculaceae bacterium]|nr:iron ABC transporter permease [Parvularculaceae bacterium]
MRRNEIGATAALAAAGLFIVFISCLFGPGGLSPLAAAKALFGAGDPAFVMVAEQIRLPRALAAFLAGAALGASGAGLQGLLRNPLADPGVLGLSTAASLGAVIAIYFNLALIAPFTTPLAAVIFALGATAALYLLGAGRVSTARLILVGVGLASFTTAMIALLMNLAPNPFALSDLVSWLFGTVANRSFSDLAIAAPLMAAGLALLLASGRGLRALALGEEAAASLGADLFRLRGLVIAGSALLVGASVSLAGAVGFVGVVAPHVARPFVGHDPAKTIIPAALIGGALLAAADLFVRLMPFDQELKLGVAAALIGAPGFVWIAARTRRLAA